MAGGLLNTPPFPGGLLGSPVQKGLLGAGVGVTPGNRYPRVPTRDPQAGILGKLLAGATSPIEKMSDISQGDYSPLGVYWVDGEGWVQAPEAAIPFATEMAGVATTGSLAAPAVRNATGMGIRAYHGSPHDFDRFSMDKIGTGEGAQAYGHGLYFAESPGVAQSYKEALANRKTMPGNTPSPLKTAWSVVSGSAERAAMATDDLLPYVKKAWPDVPDAEIRAAIDEAKAAWSPGRMYEVDINASPDEFLDWDKPLSEQPEVMARLSKSKRKAVQNLLAQERFADLSKSRELYGQDLGPLTGQDLIKALSLDLEGRTVGAKSGEALRAAGIKGIRYKDAGSRAISPAADQMVSEFGSVEKALEVAQQRLANARSPRDAIKAEEMVTALTRTHNYVVFDDKNISILKKYGIAGLMAGGAGAAALGGGTQDASAATASYSTGGRF